MCLSVSFNLADSFFIFSLLEMLIEDFVSAENSVPDAEERAVIADVGRVMEVMVLSWAWERNKAVGRPRELVPTMPIESLTEANGVPSKYRQHVRIRT